MTPEDVQQAAERYEEISVVQAAKRCGMQWAPWMGDWFTSWSPRNSNNNAEGPWDHWVDLALAILQDPMTIKVRPAAWAAVANMPLKDLYDAADISLTDDDLAARF